MQRQVVLPKLLAGESLIALGYSEPDSGSDVAAARTRAVRDGDGWRIDGQKIFTSLAEESEWVFLLTRTDPDVAKHQGLTFFLVPTSAPGFELQPIRTLSGKRTNTTFYDGVYVDDEWRVGEVERRLAGDAGRALVRAWRRRRGTRRRAAPHGGRGARAYGDTRRRIVTARRPRPAPRPRRGSRSTARSPTCSRRRAVWVAATGALPGVEGAATQALRHRGIGHATNRLLDACGPAGLVQAHDVTDLSAFYEYNYRFAPVTTIYGGTSEIQRNLVAQRRLGLPRSR